MEDRLGYVNVNNASLLEGEKGTDEEIINKEIIKENLCRNKFESSG